MVSPEFPRSPPAVTSSSPINLNQVLHGLTSLESYDISLKRPESAHKKRENWLEGEENMFEDIENSLWGLQNGGQRVAVDSEKVLNGLIRFVGEMPLGQRKPEDINYWLTEGKSALPQLLADSEELRKEFHDNKKEKDIEARIAKRLINRIEKKVDEQGQKLDEQGQKLDEQGQKFALFQSVINEFKARFKVIEGSLSQMWKKVFGTRNCLIGSLRDEEIRKEVQEVRVEYRESSKRWVYSVAEKEINRIAEKLGKVKEKISLFAVSLVKDIDNLPEKVKEASMVIVREKVDGRDVYHAVPATGIFGYNGEYYILAREEDNFGGETQFNKRRIHSSQFVRLNGEIAVISYQEYAKYFEREFSDEEKSMLSDREIEGIGGGSTGGGGQGGGTAGQGGTGTGAQGGQGGGTGTAGQGGAIDGQGGAGGGSSPLGGGAGTADIPIEPVRANTTNSKGLFLFSHFINLNGFNNDRNSSSPALRQTNDSSRP